MKHILFTIFILFAAIHSEARLLRFGLPNAIGHLDQTKPLLAQPKYLLTLIYEPLLRANSNQELEPALSKSWEIDNTKKIATFSLAPKHSFSDGTLVEADDVVLSFKELCSTKSDAKKDLTAIVGCGTDQAEVRKIDSQTLQIKFDGPSPILLYQLAGFRAGITKRKGEAILGSGPYKLDSRTDKSLKLLPNPYFHSQKDLQNDGLEFITVGEKNVDESIVKQSLDGTIMFRFGVMDSSIKGFQYIDDHANITMTLIPNLQRAPFNDPDFRKALMTKLANNSAFASCNAGIRPAQGIIPNGLGGSIAHLSLKPPSPKVSIEKIIQRNKGLKIAIHRHIGRRNECEENVLISAFASLGVTATIKYHDEYDTLLPLYQNHGLDAFLELYIFANREAMTIFRKFGHKGDNLANIKSSIIDDAMLKIWSAKSNSERFQNYRNLNQAMYQEALVFPLYYLNHRNMVSECLENISEDFAFNPFFGLARATIKKACK